MAAFSWQPGQTSIGPTTISEAGFAFGSTIAILATSSSMRQERLERVASIHLRAGRWSTLATVHRSVSSFTGGLRTIKRSRAIEIGVRRHNRGRTATSR